MLTYYFVNEFEQWVLQLWYFTWIKTLTWVLKLFSLSPWNLTFFQNFNIATCNKFWIVCSKVLIFRKSIFCKEAFSWVPTSLTLWPWPWILRLPFEKINCFAYNISVLQLWSATWIFLVIRSSVGTKLFVFGMKPFVCVFFFNLTWVITAKQ